VKIEEKGQQKCNKEIQIETEEHTIKRGKRAHASAKKVGRA